MTTQESPSRWESLLATADQTPLPRWPDTDFGTATGELIRELPGLAGARWQQVLAAHAKVIAAVTGNPAVLTAHTADGLAVLPVQVTVPDGSWADLVAAVPDVLGGHDEYRVALAALGLDHAPIETVLDTSGLVSGQFAPRPLAAHEVLAVAFALRGDTLELRLTHRRTEVGAEQADRIAGYYATALTALIEDPQADHLACDLISPAELAFQLDGLAGRTRELPDLRPHQVIERWARRTPDAIAATHLGARLTYRDLNTRANRVARALRARGLADEDVVAVVTERNLDWLVAVLAVLKAGGVYLPVEPHFPADRIATMLTTSGCTHLLTEQASAANLGPTPAPLMIADLYAEDHDIADLDLPIGPDRLAYVYFTSGSTGAPKGAMCEHAGMLNHLYAKIDDLEIGEGQVVAQTAPQCFDISLWQLLAPLLVGGRTLLVEQDAILDIARFLDRVVGGDVEVLQLVPSYLEVVLAHLEARPRPLGRLRCVSVTGEAIKKELVVRWFARFPDLPLVNAYGLTETSDDTNHEVLRAVPTHSGVPLGRPIANIGVYVVDDRLRPVPLGAPGEIVFSGVCVGRGYINDQERTAAAFLDDPHRPGRRLYRSGDFGRWLPGGTLGFSGRRDAQVKIRGHRIEIGEIENQLLRVPGVSDAAVVITGSSDAERTLIGFHLGTATEETVLTALADVLPIYMVPHRSHRIDVMPVTGNGKSDRKALIALAGDLAGPAGPVQQAKTPAEQRLATAWAEVLRVPVTDIDRERSFFDLGGTSLSAVKLVINSGRWFSLAELVAHPVLADLAELVADRDVTAVSAGTDAELVVSRAERTPPVITVAEPPKSTVDWMADNVEALRAVIAADGAVLVRGLGITSADQVGALAAILGAPVAEREGFAPRKRYADGLYGSSEWPPDQPMCMHHELSYRLEAPSLMVFGCLRAPADGGATALADSRDLLAALPTDLVERFERDGWILERNYTGLVGVTWQEAFGVTEPGEVDRYCADNAIEHTWTTGGGLRTTQHRPAVVAHPITGQRCWFNQIAFLNEWTMDPDVRSFLVAEFGPAGLPFTTTHGDGTPLDEATVRVVNTAYESVTQREPWRDGDLLIVDNIRMAHSREPYTGPRDVVVAMAGPVRLTPFPTKKEL